MVTGKIIASNNRIAINSNKAAPSNQPVSSIMADSTSGAANSRIEVSNLASSDSIA